MAERNVISIEWYLMVNFFFLIFSYWENVIKLLWNRFEAIMNAHNESVRNLDVKKLQIPVDSRPHYVSFMYFLNFNKF